MKIFQVFGKVFCMGKKDYQVDKSMERDILFISITGKASKRNAGEIARIVFEAVQELKPIKVLVDCTKLVGRLSLTETYYHVREYPAQPHVVSKSAIVDLPENAEYYNFHQVTAANVGVPMKYFTDIDTAVEWLNQ